MSGISRTGSKKTGAVATNSQPASGDKKHEKSAPASVGDDQLQVSAEAQRIDELFQSLADVEEVNQSRVESIRRALKNGELPVDYPLLASKILELTDELNRDES